MFILTLRKQKCAISMKRMATTLQISLQVYIRSNLPAIRRLWQKGDKRQKGGGGRALTEKFSSLSNSHAHVTLAVTNETAAHRVTPSKVHIIASCARLKRFRSLCCSCPFVMLFRSSFHSVLSDLNSEANDSQVACWNFSAGSNSYQLVKIIF